MSDQSAFSINPSLLLKSPLTPEHVPQEEHDITDQPPDIAPSPLNISVAAGPSPSPLTTVRHISPELPVQHIDPHFRDIFEGPEEAVKRSCMKRKRVLPRRRPRTRQYVRTVRSSSDRDDAGSDSEYLDSDPEDSANDDLHEGGTSAVPSSKRRRKADTYVKRTGRIRCEEPFCSRSFTRPADLRRHIATIHKDLSRREVYKETREEYRLWCKKCDAILGRVDARQRHESHGSCERSQAIMEARIRNGTIRGRASRGQLK